MRGSQGRDLAELGKGRVKLGQGGPQRLGRPTYLGRSVRIEQHRNKEEALEAAGLRE